jgi:hypothetical protein
MTQTICAYCQAPGTLTREHLWPKSLQRRQTAANEMTSNAYWLARLQKYIPNEPQIRDVCAICNNEILSDLDTYVCGLFESTFVHIPARHTIVRFEYNYHMLKRWLLKLCFNSARIHNSRDLHALEVMRPYILGRDNLLGKSVQLFVQLSYPEELPEDVISPTAPAERPLLFRPRLNRVGHMFFRVPGVGEKLLRAVHLRSFTFFLAFFKPDEARAVMDDFADHFSRHSRATVLLRASQPTVELLCNGTGAWTSFKGSKENQLIFDSDA